MIDLTEETWVMLRRNEKTLFLKDPPIINIYEMEKDNIRYFRCLEV